MLPLEPRITTTRETTEMDMRVAEAHSEAAAERAYRNRSQSEAAAERRAGSARRSVLDRLLGFLRRR